MNIYKIMFLFFLMSLDINVLAEELSGDPKVETAANELLVITSSGERRVISGNHLTKKFDGDLVDGSYFFCGGEEVRYQYYGKAYNYKFAKLNAIRDFIENNKKIYAISINGDLGELGYPNINNIEDYEDYEVIVINPTSGCSNNLTDVQAYKYAQTYNKSLLAIIEKVE